MISSPNHQIEPKPIIVNMLTDFEQHQLKGSPASIGPTAMLGKNERIVSMVAHKGELFVATESSVYIITSSAGMTDKELKPLRWAAE